MKMKNKIAKNLSSIEMKSLLAKKWREDRIKSLFKEVPKDKKILEYRMYCLVNRSLSPIQKGIQAAHAIVEYASLFGKDKEYKRWAEFDKTIIILDGGTSNDNKQSFYGVSNYCGDMEFNIKDLEENKIKHAYFKEPDLNWTTTAICCLADERTWDKKKYPIPKRNEFLLWDTLPPGYRNETFMNDYGDDHKPITETWLKKVGGKENDFLRYFLGKFKLAI